MVDAPTTNYGWVIPSVGSDTDSWGGYINSDIRAIDTVVKGIDTRAFADATSDGTLWARKNATWQHITHNDITDWAANQYTLPTASPSVLGGVKIDNTTITINSGVISAGGTFAAGISVNGPATLAASVFTQASTTMTLNLSAAENFVVTLTSNVNSIGVAPSWPTAGKTGKARITFINTGSFTVTGWPAGTIWPSGTPPIITPGSGKKDIVMLMTDDAGTTIYGSIIGQDYR